MWHVSSSILNLSITSLALTPHRIFLQPILGIEGIEQIAALMPRTISDLLQVEGMTARKVERYAPRIMDLLKKYWLEVDGEAYFMSFRYTDDF